MINQDSDEFKKKLKDCLIYFEEKQDLKNNNNNIYKNAKKYISKHLK